MCLADKFNGQKNLVSSERHSPMMLNRWIRKNSISERLFLFPLRHPSNLPPRRNVGLQAMPFIGLGVADYSQRSTQPKRNAELSCLVASGRERKKCWRYAGDLEIHGCCGVARFFGGWLETFLGRNLKIGLNEISRISDVDSWIYGFSGRSDNRSWPNRTMKLGTNYFD